MREVPELPRGCKLNDDLQRKLCSYIANQLTMEDACDAAGINRSTVWEWRGRGQEDPASRFGEFEREITKALIAAKATLITKIATHPDLKGAIFLLKNRYPLEYKDRYSQELMGKDGNAIETNTTLNPFVVNFTMPAPDETEFTTVNHQKPDAG